MNILVLSSGAKDTAIAWWLSKSKLIEGLYIAPGCPGTEDFAINLPDVDIQDCDRVVKACKEHSIDYVVIGTEGPELAGVVDRLNAEGIATFGAPLKSLILETDRIWSRDFAKRCGITCPNFRVFNNLDEMKAFLDGADKGAWYTLKPNGFTISRNIVNSSVAEDLLAAAEPMLKKGPVLLEDHIDGLPLTVTVLIDMKGYLALPLCSEYTKPEHGDGNVVTGGMGAVCPIPVTDEFEYIIDNNLVRPVYEQLKKEDLLYKGVLTLSLVHKGNVTYLVDFHLRFNDPAAQTMMPLITSDAVDVLRAMENNTLSDFVLSTDDASAVSVVIASEGYPQKPKKGLRFKNTAGAPDNRLVNAPLVFLGAVGRDSKGAVVTTGGRAATVVGLGTNISEANSAAYRAVASVSFKGSWYREDIGNKFFSLTVES